MGHLALRIWDEAEISGYTFPMCFGSGTRKRACEIMHETACKAAQSLSVRTCCYVFFKGTRYHIYVTSISHNAPHILSVIGPRVWGLYGQTIW